MDEIKKNDIKIYQFPMVEEEDEEEDAQDLQVIYLSSSGCRGFVDPMPSGGITDQGKLRSNNRGLDRVSAKQL